MTEQRKPRCHNCIFSGQQFKVNKLTHLHCGNSLEVTPAIEGEPLTAWDSLRVFNDTCKNHVFKQPKK